MSAEIVKGAARATTCGAPVPLPPTPAAPGPPSKEKPSVAPLAANPLGAPNEPPPLNCSVPVLAARAPLKVLVPESVTEPGPVFVRPPVPPKPTASVVASTT